MANKPPKPISVQLVELLSSKTWKKSDKNQRQAAIAEWENSQQSEIQSRAEKLAQRIRAVNSDAYLKRMVGLVGAHVLGEYVFARAWRPLKDWESGTHMTMDELVDFCRSDEFFEWCKLMNESGVDITKFDNAMVELIQSI